MGVLRAGARLAAVVGLLAALSLVGSGAASGFALRTVAPGESLGTIADVYGVSVDAITAANDLGSTLIHPGDTLRIPLVDALGGAAEAAPPPPPGFQVHTLAPGETLSEVTSGYGVSLDALVGANPDLSSLDRLPVGVELLIPPGEGLAVALQPGERLADLVAAYGVDAAEVARVNELASPFDVRPGMLLWLPGVRPDAALERLARVREIENTYIWPVHGRITSYFGRRNLGMGTSGFHRGLDVAAPWGTAVVAARAGTVTFAGWSSAGYGYMVKVRHMGNEETWYAHFSSLSVRVGEYVEQGQVIGGVGSTGLSTGPHLHLELHRSGVPHDPLGDLR